MRYYVLSNANSIENPTQSQACPSATQIQFSTMLDISFCTKESTEQIYMLPMNPRGQKRNMMMKNIGNKLKRRK